MRARTYRRSKESRYPYDLVQTQIPAETMEAAHYETFRFLFNWDAWKGDMRLLCALCYLQGALDGAQVQQQLSAAQPQEEGR